MISFEDLLLSLVKKRFYLVTVVCLLAGAASAYLTDFRIGHSYDDWIDHDSPLFRGYRQLVETFGDPDTLLVAFRVADINDSRVEGYLELVDKLRWMDGVTVLFDPLELFLGATADNPPQARDIRRLRSEFRGRAADYRNVLLSRDVETAGLLILMDPAERDTHPQILSVAKQGFDALAIPHHFGGTTYFSETLRLAITRDMTRVISILVVITMAILLIFLGNLPLVLCVFAGIGLSLLGTLACSTAAGLNLNLLTLILFPLVFCVGVTTAVHLFSHRQDDRWSLEQAYRRVARPALIAAATTAVGCTAFIFAPQTTVARMGLILPVGVALTFFSMVIFVPAALRSLTGSWQLPNAPCHPLIPTARVRRYISLGLLGTAVVAAIAVPRITTNPDAIYFFKEHSELIGSYRFIENHLTGMLVIDMVIRATDGGPVTVGIHKEQIDNVLHAIRGHAQVTTVASGYDLLRLPGMDEMGNAGFGSAFFSADRTATRVSIRCRNISPYPYARIARDLNALWDELNTTGLHMRLTGLIPLILEAQDRLLKIQSKVLVAVLLVMSLILLLVFRSMKLLMLALIANFVPLLITAGAMVVLAIPVNSINLFVASVMLGIIADDTVHLLYAFRKTGSLDAALQEVGAALWITSVTVTLAFASLLFSSLVPISQFGLLSAIAVISAYGCDVCLLPFMMRDKGVSA